MASIRVVGYRAALEYIRTRGAECGLPDLERLTEAAFWKRVGRKSIPHRRRPDSRAVVFELVELEAWIVGDRVSREAA